MGHLWLIGMMGSGKTTIGKRVSAALDLPFIDSDELIAESLQKTIDEIFSEDEAVFREVERRTLAEISHLHDHVVATGGGVVLDERNVTTMRTSGTTILLDADVAALIKRLHRSTGRPLLRTNSDIAVIAEARAGVYAAAADVLIDTSQRSIQEVTDEVSACRAM
jgi:shikimate kinase